MERYTGLVQQIREKSKECKALIAEKKESPVYRVKRHKTLAVRIAELTEDLEELCFEKALLLQKFEYAEDAGAEAFRKDIDTMEAGLKKLEAQEQKYSAELDKALDEYAELKAQTADFDPVELYEARQAIRPTQEKAAEQQLEDTMQEKLSLVYRFGLKIFFCAPNKKEFQNIVKVLAQKYGITMPEEELLLQANQWELQYGGLSGRTAQQFIDHLLGQRKEV